MSAPSWLLPFQIEVKTVVSRLLVAQIQPGTAAKVEYNPNNPQRIRVLSMDAAGADAVSRLELLEQMHSKQLITSEEYQQKRSEILKEL